MDDISELINEDLNEPTILGAEDRAKLEQSALRVCRISSRILKQALVISHEYKHFGHRYVFLGKVRCGRVTWQDYNEFMRMEVGRLRKLLLLQRFAGRPRSCRLCLAR